MGGLFPEAIRNTDIDGVEYHLKHGADPNVPGRTTGIRPLTLAGTHVEILELLLDYGADPDGQKSKEFPETALHRLIRQGRPESRAFFQEVNRTSPSMLSPRVFKSQLQQPDREEPLLSTVLPGRSRRNSLEANDPRKPQTQRRSRTELRNFLRQSTAATSAMFSSETTTHNSIVTSPSFHPSKRAMFSDSPSSTSSVMPQRSHGMRSPQPFSPGLSGMMSPNRMRSPVRRSFGSPRRSFGSPRRTFGSPIRGMRSPVRGFGSPFRGMRSPSSQNKSRTSPTGSNSKSRKSPQALVEFRIPAPGRASAPLSEATSPQTLVEMQRARGHELLSPNSRSRTGSRMMSPSHGRTSRGSQRRPVQQHPHVKSVMNPRLRDPLRSQQSRTETPYRSPQEFGHATSPRSKESVVGRCSSVKKRLFQPSFQEAFQEGGSKYGDRTPSVASPRSYRSPEAVRFSPCFSWDGAVRLLLQRGADPNLYPCNDWRRGSHSPFARALDTGLTGDAMDMLILAGGGPDKEQEAYGITALHLACEAGKLGTVAAMFTILDLYNDVLNQEPTNGPNALSDRVERWAYNLKEVKNTLLGLVNKTDDLADLLLKFSNYLVPYPDLFAKSKDGGQAIDYVGLQGDMFGEDQEVEDFILKMMYPNQHGKRRRKFPDPEMAAKEAVY